MKISLEKGLQQWKLGEGVTTNRETVGGMGSKHSSEALYFGPTYDSYDVNTLFVFLYLIINLSLQIKRTAMKISWEGVAALEWEVSIPVNQLERGVSSWHWYFGREFLEEKIYFQKFKQHDFNLCSSSVSFLLHLWWFSLIGFQSHFV